MIDKIKEICKHRTKEELFEIINALCHYGINMQRTCNYHMLYSDYMQRIIDVETAEQRDNLDKWFDDEIESNEQKYVIPIPKIELSSNYVLKTLCELSELLGYKYIDDMDYFNVKVEKPENKS